MTLRVTLNEWDSLSAALRRFGDAGEVTIEKNRIHIDFGSAHVEVTRDGTVRTGMPLHDFTHDDTAVIVLDHDAGTLTIDADTVTYTFRRPGG